MKRVKVKHVALEITHLRRNMLVTKTLMRKIEKTSLTDSPGEPQNGTFFIQLEKGYSAAYVTQASIAGYS